MPYFKCACEGGGLPGTPGANGLSIRSGHGVPTDPANTVAAGAVVGDFYLDLDTYILYGPRETLTTWVGAMEAALIGATGAAGKSMLHGTAAPTNDLVGNDGDFWLETTSYTLYGPKDAGTWVGVPSKLLIGAPGADALWNWRGEYDNGAEYNIGDLVYHPASGSSYYRSGDPLNQGYAPPDPVRWTLIAKKGDDGAAGSDGNTILTFQADPTTPGDDGVGADGDYWLNQSTYTLYGPKAAGVWPVTGHALTGTAGAAGTQIVSGAGYPWNAGPSADNMPIGDYYIDINPPATLYGPKVNATDWLGSVTAIQIEGAQGAPGTPGSQILSNTGTPSGTFTPGDYYFQIDTKDLWGPADITGTLAGPVNLSGLQGDPGADGSHIIVDTGTPSYGVDGDIWIDSTTGYLYGPMAGGVWNTSSWVDLNGPAGARGATIWNGTTTPDNAIIDGSLGGGAYGDFFIDTTAAAGPTMYGPRGVSSWNLATAVVLKGDKGDTGSFGGATFPYLFSSTTPAYGSATDPGAQYFTLSLAAAGSGGTVKTLCIHQNDKDLANISGYLETIDDSTSAVKGHVKFEKNGDPTVFEYYAITGFHTQLSSTGGTYYYRVPLTLLASNGTFSNNDTINATFVRTGDKGDTGTGGVVAVRGAYHSEVTQTADTSGGSPIATAMTFPVADLVSQTVTLDLTTSKLKVPEAGTYNVQFSAQIQHAGGGSAVTNIWFRVNGTDVPNSDTKVTIPASGAYAVAAWNIMLDLAANDEVQIMWKPDATDVVLQAEASTATTPAIPSVIVTVDRLAYSGKSTYQEWQALGNSGNEAEFIESQRGPGVWTYPTGGVAPTVNNPLTGYLHKAGDYVIDNSTFYKEMWGPFSLPNTWPGPVELVGRDGANAVSGTPWFYGDGSAGNVTISSNTTLTESKMYNNLTIAPGVSLDTDGYHLFVKDTLTLGNGAVIHCNGSDAIDSVAGAVSTPGSYKNATLRPYGATQTSASVAGYYAGGNGGTAGRITVTNSQSAGSFSATINSVSNSFGGAGGQGGSCVVGGITTNASAGGTVTGPATYLYPGGNIAPAVLDSLISGAFPVFLGTADYKIRFNGGAGGSGGGAKSPATGTGIAAGGGGGGGGAVLVVFAKTIVVSSGTATISANGGRGGNAFASFGAAGGGAGGGGGLAVVVSSQAQPSGLYVQANGGAGGTGAVGTGGTSAADGAAGSAGTVMFHVWTA